MECARMLKLGNLAEHLEELLHQAQEKQLCLRDPFVSFHRMPGNIPCLQAGQKIFQRNHIRPVSVFHRLMDKPGGDIGLSCSGPPP